MARTSQHKHTTLSRLILIPHFARPFRSAQNEYYALTQNRTYSQGDTAAQLRQLLDIHNIPYEVGRRERRAGYVIAYPPHQLCKNLEQLCEIYPYKEPKTLIERMQEEANKR